MALAHARLYEEPRPPTMAELIAKYDGRVPRYTSYPTAPHFHAGITAAEYRSWLAALNPKQPISLYLHIPFCHRLCWYCGCNTSVTHRAEPITAYIDALIAEMALVARAIGRQLPVSSVHFGGGTPNSMSPGDLERVFAAINRYFTLTPDAEIAAEIDPRVLTPEWIQAAARAGLNRASLGVQDIDPTVQDAINRVQPWAETERATLGLRAAGIRSINLDLIYGLPHQSLETIARTIDQVVQIAPERIALFGYAHVPWMKPAQKLIDTAILPDAGARHAQQEEAATRLQAAGYIRVGLDHFVLPDDKLAQSAGVRRNFQGYTTDDAQTLLGLGASSIGRLHQGYVQNATDMRTWRAALAESHLPVARGIALSEDDRQRGAIIERLMCEFAIDLADFPARPGFDPHEFEDERAALTPFLADGLVTLAGTELTVTNTGRPFVRAVCAVFDRYLEVAAARHSRAI